jgi:hypothetical protein
MLYYIYNKKTRASEKIKKNKVHTIYLILIAKKFTDLLN